MRIDRRHAIFGGFLETFHMEMHILASQTALLLSNSFIYHDGYSS